MLVFVKYVARFGLFIALIVLNTGVALLLLLLHWLPAHGPACLDRLFHLKPQPLWPA